MYAHPTEAERYFLRGLLNHVRGATSYEDLRTLGGITYPTFRETCEKRGLVKIDNTLGDTLRLFLYFVRPPTYVSYGTNTRILCLRIIVETILTQV